MRDTTQWRKDADRLRQSLLNAYRSGDITAIAHATQALEILLGRADRPPHSAGKARSRVACLAKPAQRGHDILTLNRGAAQPPPEMPSCSTLAVPSSQPE